MTAGYCITSKQVLCVFLLIFYCLTLSLPLSLSLCFSAFFIIVSQIDRSNLYCNSVAITKENFNDSTIFCHVAGGTMIFCISN